MRIKIMLSLLILFMGLSSLTKAENKANNGYLISDTPLKVHYIICSAPHPKKCDPDKIQAESAPLDVMPKTYMIKNIPEEGVARIVKLTTANHRHYIYPDDYPCLLYPNEAIKFEVYDDIIVCRSERPTVAVAQ